MQWDAFLLVVGIFALLGWMAYQARKGVHQRTLRGDKYRDTLTITCRCERKYDHTDTGVVK